MTGGRLKRIQNLIDDTFCLTYGDTVNNVNIEELITFHKKESRLATVTSCIPPQKYGVLEIKENKVISFKEKSPMEEVWVNGGFFVLEPQVFDYLQNDSTIWEKEPMEGLVKNNQLSAYKHSGFYQHMDTITEKNFLNKLWQEEKAKWKVW
jgi:glucose-1-phosphate cytidylyltransferase